MAEPEKSNLPATVYLNGRFMAAAEARLPVDDHGVLFGLGFFETFRTSGGRPHHWSFNRRRLEQACATAGIRLPREFLAVDEARLASVVADGLRHARSDDAVFRYTVTAGAPTTSLARVEMDPREVGERADAIYDRPNELLKLRPLPAAAPAGGICLRVLNATRDNGEWLPRPKSLNYANARLGAAELQRRGAEPGDEGLFLSRHDRFAVETVRQSIAWIRDGQLCYPDPALGAVAGTCLAWVLELGAPAAAVRAPIEELLGAEAIVVMNSVRGITPVREVRGPKEEILRAALMSHQNPLVVSLRQQWIEALETTARNPLEPRSCSQRET